MLQMYVIHLLANVVLDWLLFWEVDTNLMHTTFKCFSLLYVHIQQTLCFVALAFKAMRGRARPGLRFQTTLSFDRGVDYILSKREPLTQNHIVSEPLYWLRIIHIFVDF